MLTVSWLWLQEINPQIKRMLEPVGEGHSEKCGCLHFPSMSLVPAVGWAALLPRALPPAPPRAGAPSASVAPLQRWRRAGLAWRLPSSAASWVLAGEQVGQARGQEPHAALWSLFGCPTDPFVLPRQRVWVALLLVCDGQGGRVLPGVCLWARGHGLAMWPQ